MSECFFWGGCCAFVPVNLLYAFACVRALKHSACMRLNVFRKRNITQHIPGICDIFDFNCISDEFECLLRSSLPFS